VLYLRCDGTLIPVSCRTIVDLK